VIIVPEHFQKKADELLADKKISYRLADSENLLKVIFVALSD
jgi:hypothetical protein